MKFDKHHHRTQEVEKWSWIGFFHISFLSCNVGPHNKWLSISWKRVLWPSTTTNPKPWPSPSWQFQTHEKHELGGKITKDKRKLHLMCTFPWMGEVKQTFFLHPSHPPHQIAVAWIWPWSVCTGGWVGGWEWPWARRYVENYSSFRKIFRWPLVMKIFQWPWKIAHHLKSNLKSRYFNLSIKEKLFSFVYHVEIPLWLHPLLHLKWGRY